MKRAIMALAALALMAPAAHAQVGDPEYDALQARFRAFHEALADIRERPDRWTVVFSRVDAFGTSWMIVSFGPDPNTPAPRRWRAQRVVRGTEAPWVTDAASCPALLDQLGAVEGIPAPTIDVPHAGHELPPPTEVGSVVMDGDDNRLWTNQAHYASRWTFGEIEISGNTDSPLARWGDNMIAALAPCWRPPTN